MDKLCWCHLSTYYPGSAPRTFVFTIRGHIYCLVSLYLFSQIHCCYNLCVHITGFPQTTPKETSPGSNDSKLSAELPVDTTPHTGQQCTILTWKELLSLFQLFLKSEIRFFEDVNINIISHMSEKPKTSLLACLMPHYYIP